MESLLHTPSSLVSLRLRIDGLGSFINPSCVCLNPSLSRRGSKSIPLGRGREKDDNHSFSARPDEPLKKINEEGDFLPEFADAEEQCLKEKKGIVWRFSDWEMRRLAYKIQKAENAHYILMNFEIEAKYLNEFKGLLDSDERLIRHLVMKRDEAITEDCPPPPEFHSVRAV